jgi:hypothetical protein
VWLAVAGFAFFLRLGMAWVTRTHPLFPDYYYTDARHIDNAAAAAVGKPFTYAGTLSQRIHVRLQSSLYRIIGIHPFVMKIVNCMVGALGVFALLIATSNFFSPGPTLLTGIAYALWPSNIFYTSQNFKEAPTNFFAFCALAFLLRLLAKKGPRFFAFGGILAAILTGLFRSHVMATLCAAVAISAIAGLLIDRKAKHSVPLLLALSAAVAAPILYLPTSRFLLTHWVSGQLTGAPRLHPRILPVTYDIETKHAYKPTSPQGLSEFRRLRQESDRLWAHANAGRNIGTQIFPDERFTSWWDVATFIPKASFYTLFMPLPGLYPIEGKIGRLLGSIENLFLLVIAALGLIGAVTGPKSLGRSAMLIFFAGMTVGSALLEFDLGSAGRHKLLYLPMLFPFAADMCLSLLHRQENV